MFILSKSKQDILIKIAHKIDCWDQIVEQIDSSSLDTSDSAFREIYFDFVLEVMGVSCEGRPYCIEYILEK